MAKKLTEEETNKFFKLLQEACALAEWDIAFDSSDAPVDGMIIGNYEYINRIVSSLEGEFEGHEITETDDDDEIIH